MSVIGFQTGHEVFLQIGVVPLDGDRINRISGLPDTMRISVSNHTPMDPQSSGQLSVSVRCNGVTVGGASVFEGFDSGGSIVIPSIYIIDADSPAKGQRFAVGGVGYGGGQFPGPEGGMYGMELYIRFHQTRPVIPGEPISSEPLPFLKVNVYISATDSYGLGVGPDTWPADDPPENILPPTNLTALWNLNQESVQLAWADNSDNETGFTLEWSTVPPDVWQPFISLPADSFQHVDATIEPNTEYSYRVFAYKDAAEFESVGLRSIYSNIAITDAPVTFSPPTGSTDGGTDFLFTGFFDPDATTTVKFGTISATPILVTEGQITGKAPIHVNGVVDVTLVHAGETSVFDFEYIRPNSIPHIVVSQDQRTGPPIPKIVRLTAEVVDDPQGLFDAAVFLWKIYMGPPIGIDPTLVMVWNVPTIDEVSRIISPSALETDVVFSRLFPGRYIYDIKATGTDENGDDLVIWGRTSIIMSSARAPRVQALSLSTRDSQSVTAFPEVSDDGGGGQLTFAWTQVSGPASATIASPSTQSTEIAFPSSLQGVYTFKLSVSNGTMDGVGITKVSNLTGVAAAPPAAETTVTVTLNGSPL